MKKSFKQLIFLLLIFLNSLIPVAALSNQNRAVKIHFNNIDYQDGYFMDILIPDLNQETLHRDSDDLKEHIAQLYTVDGYVIRTLTNKDITKEVINKKDRVTVIFKGLETKNIKVIIVNPDLEVSVSEVINLEAVDSVVYYNIFENSFRIQNVFTHIIFQFIFAFIVVFIIKVLLLYPFKIKLDDVLRPLIITNVILLTLYTGLVSSANFLDGSLFAIKTAVILGILSLIVETIIYLFTFKHDEKLNVFIYSSVINIASIIINILFIFITKL